MKKYQVTSMANLWKGSGIRSGANRVVVLAAEVFSAMDTNWLIYLVAGGSLNAADRFREDEGGIPSCQPEDFFV